MSELGESLAGHKNLRALLRAHYGIPCPECVRLLPKAHPKILLPGGYCKMHRHKDKRAELTQEDYDRLQRSAK